MRFACISEQTAIISLYNINLSVFVTEAASVYCAVRTESLNQKDAVSSLKRLMLVALNRTEMEVLNLVAVGHTAVQMTKLASQQMLS
jgi:hypothetical protein